MPRTTPRPFAIEKPAPNDDVATNEVPAAWLAYDHIPTAIAVVDEADTAVFVNRWWRTAAAPVLAERSDDDGPLLLSDLVHPDDHTPLKETLADTDNGHLDARLHLDGAHHRWHELSIAAPVDGHRVVSAVDVEERVSASRRFAEMLTVRNEMLDASVDCIKIIDPDGRVLHMNQSGCSALGITPEQITAGFGMMWLDLLPPEVRACGRSALAQARAGRNARFDGMSILGDQTPQHWDNILTPVLDADGRTTAILCVSRDITLQREAERRLRVASETDDLTELLNRRAFRARLRRTIAKARTRTRKVGMLLMNLDHFKNVNDTLGHLAGDHLLRVLARRLRGCVPANAFIGRLGGDEFAIVIDGTTDEELLALGDIVLLQLDSPISHSGRRIDGAMSIGSAMFPRDAWDEGGLMACADAALFDLKAAGRGGIRVFNQGMLDAAEAAATEIERARTLVRTDGVVPHYQPKVRLSDGRVVGFEALLRWPDEHGVMQPPSTVAEAFKDYELATGLGAQMHEKVLSDLASWRARGLPLVPVSINAAPVELLRGDFPARLLEKMAAFEIGPELIELEITEMVLLERGADFVTKALCELKEAGVRIALDDFGTGHSSFAHLRDYPIDTIKVDRTFVSRMVDEPQIHAIVQAIAELGPALDVSIVAEGVETELQRQILTSGRCTIGQGYLFGTAVSADAASRILRDPNRLAPTTADRQATARPLRAARPRNSKPQNSRPRFG